MFQYFQAQYQICVKNVNSNIKYLLVMAEFQYFWHKLSVEYQILVNRWECINKHHMHISETHSLQYVHMQTLQEFDYLLPFFVLSLFFQD